MIIIIGQYLHLNCTLRVCLPKLIIILPQLCVLIHITPLKDTQTFFSHSIGYLQVDLNPSFFSIKVVMGMLRLIMNLSTYLFTTHSTLQLRFCLHILGQSCPNICLHLQRVFIVHPGSIQFPMTAFFAHFALILHLLFLFSQIEGAPCLMECDHTALLNYGVSLNFSPFSNFGSSLSRDEHNLVQCGFE